MQINFNDIHFSVTTIAYNKFKDIFTIILSKHIISNRVCLFFIGSLVT